MLNTIVKFIKSEEGAVTVDWVVLTAGIAFLGLAVIYLIGSTTTDQSTSIGKFIGDREITGTF